MHKKENGVQNDMVPENATWLLAVSRNLARTAYLLFIRSRSTVNAIEARLLTGWQQEGQYTEHLGERGCLHVFVTHFVDGNLGAGIPV